MAALSPRRDRCNGALLVRENRGVALPVAVFALAVLGALISGSFFAGVLEQQSGQSTLFAAQAREAAEAGIAQALAELSAGTLENLPVGGAPLELGGIVVGEGVVARNQIQRLTGRVFLIRADGQRQDPKGMALTTRALGLLIQLAPPGTAAVSQPGSSELVARVIERGWVRLY